MYYKLSIALLTLVLALPLYGQDKVSISGYVTDQENGEALIGANVYIEALNAGTITNTFGYYSLTIPKGRHDLGASYIGYTGTATTIDLMADTVLNVALSSTVELAVVEITAASSSRIAERTEMSTVEVPIKQIKNIPALLGETDVLKALQLLPGVQSGGEGQSGLYVRGGSPDQNLILLDGVPVYNANHLFGFFSVFNADAIKDVKLIKGGFPARYGGRLSSVLEINMKEGNKKDFGGSASTGLVSTKLMLEGPIGKSEKTSFIVSGRRTYIDLLLRPIIQREFRNSGSEGGTGYYFYDVNAKVNHTFSDRDRLYLSVYGGEDKFYLEDRETGQAFNDITESRLGWGNQTAALRWNHVFSPRLFLNTTATYSRYALDTRNYFGTESVSEGLEDISLSYISGIDDIALKFDFDYVPSPDHFIRFGLSGIRHDFEPGQFDLEQNIPADSYQFKTTIGQDDISAVELAAYVEDDYKINDQLKVNAGLHLSGFAVEGKFYASLQPRISGRYLLTDDLSVKGSFATMRQYIQLLAFEGIGLPTDLWLPTTERVKPQDSWQAAIGAAQNIGDGYEISVEAYYKEMTNLIAYKDGSGLFEFGDWQDRVTQGDGTSYGLEVFVQKKRGRFTGWVGYTLSWSNRQFDDLNSGEEFPFRYDRRHDISVVSSFTVRKDNTLSFTWVYGTGNAITLPTGRVGIQYPNARGVWSTTTDLFDERNNFRMNAYHRMDIGYNMFKDKGKWTRTWSVGAYNAYNRKNPFFIFSEVDRVTLPDGSSQDQFALKQASLFPIIPYVTYSVTF
jgi:outer membrane receptor for ferrienterochelin and colicin